MNAPGRLPHDFRDSAAYPLFAIDPAQDRAWVLHFEREDYSQASFLDQRVLQQRQFSGWTVTHAELVAAVPPAAPDPNELHWLFHIGHCGSTLASRLLDLVPGALNLREPLPLLALAQTIHPAHLRQWLPVVRRLLTRGFADTTAVVVKPTSAVTVLAPRLLAERGRACLLWVDLQTWLATMLRAEPLVQAALATESARLPPELRDALAPSAAEGLARLWLAEQLRWHGLVSRPELAPRLIDLDFAQVLADPAGATARLARHYGLVVPTDLEDRIARSGVLGRYAKSVSQQFDASSRQRELDEALRRHAHAIDTGIGWAAREIGNLGLAKLDERLCSPR